MLLYRYLTEDTLLPITLQQVSYHFSSSVLTVVTQGYGSQTIILNALQFENTYLTFTVNVQNASSLVANFTGDWMIDTTTISLQAVYYHQSGVTKIDVEFSTLTINLQTLENDVGISLPSVIGGTLSISDL